MALIRFRLYQSKSNLGSALRAILRQDPDIIMIGEIRIRDGTDCC